MDIVFCDNTYDQAMEAYAPYYQNAPKPGMIGVFTSDTYSGTGVFSWFNSLAEVQDFILNAWLPSLTADRAEEYYYYMHYATRMLAGTTMDYHKIMELANANPFDDTYIVWMGTPEDLMTNECEFATNLREELQDLSDNETPGVEDLCEFLAGYVWA